MYFVQLVTVDFISYTWMCVQTTMAIMVAVIACATFYVIDDSNRRAEELCKTVQENYDYDCRMIINSWCRLYLEKYGVWSTTKSYYISLPNLYDQLWTRTLICLKTMQKIHHSM